MAGPAEVAQLVPGDQAVLGVVPDQDDERRLHAHRRLDLLRIHHEAGVARHRDDLAVRVGELGRDRAGHGDAHGREAVGDDAGVGPLGPVHARHPHLVRADVGDGDVVGAEHFAQVPDDLLRLDRESRCRRRTRHGPRRSPCAAALNGVRGRGFARSAIARSESPMSPSTPTATM